MTRILTTILTLGLIVVLPTLCAAGIIAHSCECESPADCHHEADCSDDPCGDDVVVSRSQGRHLDSALPIAMAAPNNALLNDNAAARPLQIIDSDAPLDAGLPLHGSDIPLLI